MTLFSEFMAELVQSRREAGKRDPVWDYAGKMSGRILAKHIGLAVPRLLRPRPYCITRWGSPPEEPACVIKPVDGCNQRGVLPLVREKGGEWSSLLGDGIRPWSAWVKWMADERLRHRSGPAPFNGPFIQEELVASGAFLPHDWKFYVIHGRVAFVHQIQKFPTRRSSLYWSSFWTREWGRAGAVLQQGREVRELEPPKHPLELVEAAELVASKVAGPFVRVDLYDGAEGPIFGEITPHPSGGKDKFTPEWDRRLGELCTKP